MKKWTPIIIVFVFLTMAGLLFYCLQSERQAPPAADPAPAATVNPAPSTPPAVKTAENMPANVSKPPFTSISPQAPLQAVVSAAQGNTSESVQAPATPPQAAPFLPAIASAPAPVPQTDIYKLYPVDGTGIYFLPAGFTALNIDGVYCDGERVEYVPVKDGTEIDIPLARRGSNVAAIITK